jgi:hypothetical protein
LTSAKTGEFVRIQRNGIELSTGKILDENLLYTRHWERNSPFSRTIIYNTSKAKSSYTGVAY